VKLTRACMDDLGALLDLHQEASQNTSDQTALMAFVYDFRKTHGIDWMSAKAAADKYAREWRRRRV
jgi:hypothetical protein